MLKVYWADFGPLSQAWLCCGKVTEEQGWSRNGCTGQHPGQLHLLTRLRHLFRSCLEPHPFTNSQYRLILNEMEIQVPTPASPKRQDKRDNITTGMHLWDFLNCSLNTTLKLCNIMRDYFSPARRILPGWPFRPKPQLCDFFTFILDQCLFASTSAVQVRLAAVALVFEVLKNLGEKVWVCIQLKHFGTHPVDDPERCLPENVLVRLVHERLERIGDLVAHVRVGEVEASLKGALQLGWAVGAVRYRVFAQQVHEHHVGRRDEALVLPALEQKSPVNVSEPEDHLSAA